MSEDLHVNQPNGLQLDIIISIDSTQCRKINCLDDADARPPHGTANEMKRKKRSERGLSVSQFIDFPINYHHKLDPINY